MGPTTKEGLVEEILTLIDLLFRRLLPTVPKDLILLDVTMPQFKIMLMLFVHGPLRMSAIAAELDVTLPTSTSLVDHLVEKDFVVRESRSDDRRVVLCRLSTAGQKALERIWESGRVHSREILEDMDSARLAMFVEILQDMMKSAKARTESSSIPN